MAPDRGEDLEQGCGPQRSGGDRPPPPEHVVRTGPCLPSAYWPGRSAIEKIVDIFAAVLVPVDGDHLTRQSGHRLGKCPEIFNRRIRKGERLRLHNAGQDDQAPTDSPGQF